MKENSYFFMLSHT